MAATTECTVIIEKTRELCQVILGQPEVRVLRQRIDAFMADEGAKALFQEVMEKGEFLQHKQQSGAQLTDAEIGDYERKRQQLVENDTARGFLDAREEMSQIQDTINRCLNKMWENGRVPEPEELAEGGSCGTGCGCH